VLELCKKLGMNVTMNVKSNRAGVFQKYFDYKFLEKHDQTWDWLINDDESAVALSWNDKKVQFLHM
jgi:hypothetical protein